jgi:hypothetical protein
MQEEPIERMILFDNDPHMEVFSQAEMSELISGFSAQ